MKNLKKISRESLKKYREV
ncbi:bacteriocin-like protein [Chryseobacterium contaminans]